MGDVAHSQRLVEEAQLAGHDILNVETMYVLAGPDYHIWTFKPRFCSLALVRLTYSHYYHIWTFKPRFCSLALVRYGDTPLLIAAQMNQIASIHSLLSMKASPINTRFNTWPLLHLTRGVCVDEGLAYL